MRKFYFILFMLLMTVMGVKARTERTSFDWSNANKEWNADKLTVDATNKIITFNNGTKTDSTGATTYPAGNAAVSWFGGTATDISAYSKLVLELSEASTADIEVVVSDGGFWGQYASTTLKTGGTKLTINLKDLKITNASETDTYKVGDAVDLTKVNMIYIRTGWVNQQTIKVKDFYLAPEDYDQILSEPIWDKTSFTWDGDNDAKIEWGATYEKTTINGTDTVKTNETAVTIDKTNKIITKVSPAWSGNNAISWYNGTVTDISGYDRLVLELKEASNAPVEVVISNGGFWGGNSSSNTLATGATELVLTLKDLTYTGTPGANDTWKKGDTLDLTKVNLIFIRTENGATNQVINVKDFYLAKQNGTKEYIIRENTTTDKYGTICLPFAASKPSNASVYEVTGKNSNGTELYISSVESMTAGKAYIFQSTDANDITFTKTGTADNLTSASNSDSYGLVGNLTGTETITSGNYVLYNNQWHETNGNRTFGSYRAYLDLSKVSATTNTTTTGLAKAMRVFGGEVTGISTINAEKNADNAPVYNLGGMRVGKQTKGVYIKNGKKYVVK